VRPRRPAGASVRPLSFTVRRHMKVWQRALLVVISLAGLYVLWRFPIGGTGSLLIAAVAVWIGRGFTRNNKVAASLLGARRDYSLRPATIAAAKGIGLFAAGMLWGLLGAYAVRLNYIPDTLVSALALIGLAVLLIVAGGVYVFMAMLKFMFGGEPPGDRFQ
jgi:hypothetical protein